MGSGNGLAPSMRQALTQNKCPASSLTHICGTRGRWVFKGCKILICFCWTKYHFCSNTTYESLIRPMRWFITMDSTLKSWILLFKPLCKINTQINGLIASTCLKTTARLSLDGSISIITATAEWKMSRYIFISNPFLVTSNEISYMLWIFCTYHCYQ